MDAIESRALEILAEVCEDSRVLEDPGLDLYRENLLDSFALVQLLEALEDELGVEIWLTQVKREETATPGQVAALVRRLAAEGWSVGIDYLQARDQALALEEELRGQGYQALAVQADVADREAITAAVTRVEMAFGPVSLLVNNAGVASQRQFQDIEEDFWRRIFAVNVDGAFHTIQAVLPHMLHEKAGSIVNISSIWGQRGASCETAYSATKAALIGLTRSLAMELAPSGIRVNCVAPGVIRTDMVEVLGRETLAALAEETPMGRLGTPEEVAEAVAFLGGDKAGFITGQVLTADGGFIL